MAKGYRRSHDREPRAKKKQVDKFERLNLTPESRKQINDLHPREKKKLLVRLSELHENFRQFTASFSTPSFRVAENSRIYVSAELDPTNHTLSLEIQ